MGASRPLQSRRCPSPCTDRVSLCLPVHPAGGLRRRAAPRARRRACKRSRARARSTCPTRSLPTGPPLQPQSPSYALAAGDSAHAAGGYAAVDRGWISSPSTPPDQNPATTASRQRSMPSPDVRPVSGVEAVTAGASFRAGPRSCGSTSPPLRARATDSIERIGRPTARARDGC